MTLRLSIGNGGAQPPSHTFESSVSCRWAARCFLGGAHLIIDSHQPSSSQPSFSTKSRTLSCTITIEFMRSTNTIRLDSQSCTPTITPTSKHQVPGATQPMVLAGSFFYTRRSGVVYITTIDSKLHFSHPSTFLLYRLTSLVTVKL